MAVRFLLGKSKAYENIILDPNIDSIYDKEIQKGKRLILGTFVARSGTRWLCDIFSSHNNVTGSVEKYSHA